MSPSVIVDDVTAISYRFAVKWSVPVQDLKRMTDYPHEFSSNRYRFKNIKNLEFSYIVDCGDDYRMRVNCITGMPIFQEDALVLMKHRVYRVKCNDTNTRGKLIFHPTVLEENSFEDDKVTFHCIMSIPVKVEAAMTKNDEKFITPYPDSNVLPVDIIVCKTIMTNPDLHPYEYDAVSEFGYSSRIPDFNVKMAVDMLGEAHKRKKPILKALCLEYLMENLTTENVAEVLTQSLESDAKDLAQKCAFFLSGRRIE